MPLPNCDLGIRNIGLMHTLPAALDNNADNVIDVLYAKIVELGRRFHSSDVAFPLCKPALTTEHED